MSNFEPKENKLGASDSSFLKAGAFVLGSFGGLTMLFHQAALDQPSVPQMALGAAIAATGIYHGISMAKKISR